MHPCWAVVLAMLPSIISDPPRRAVVVSEFVDVLDEPDDAAFSTGRLARGRKVLIVRDGPDGWCTIAPPVGSFSFVEESDLEDLGDDTARVLSRFAAVRPGRDGARVPGPPRVTLKQGTIVQLLDRRPIVQRQGGTIQSWIAIAPPKAEVRFVRASAIEERDEDVAPDRSMTPRRDRLAARRDEEISEDQEILRPNQSGLPEVGPIDPSFLAVEPSVPDEGLSAEVADRIRRITERHRAELGRPIDLWNLGPIASAYESLLKEGADSAERRAVQTRLDLLRGQESAAKAAARMAKLLSKSRARDGRVFTPLIDEADRKKDGPRRYDATGLLQTTSRLVDGRKVHALIGDDGAVVAYLAIPPGVSAGPLVSHRVGVRGAGRFDETLMARLILVQDLETLKDEDAKSSKSRSPQRTDR